MHEGWTLLAAGLAAAWAARWLRRWGPRWWRAYRRRFTRLTQQRLDALFLNRDVFGLWRAVWAAAGAAALGGYAWSGQWWLALLCALLTMALPPWLARWAWRRRAQRVTAQLPAWLLSLAWALRAGASLPGALRAVSAEAPTPLRQELALVLREQRMGLTFEQALAGWHQRLPLPAVAMTVAVLGMAGQTGGQVADTVQTLADTLDRQWRAQMRLRSLTAQSVMQARVMTALPLLLLGALQWLEPEAMAGLWHTSRGWGVLALLLLLLVSGAILLRRVLRRPL